MQCLTPVALKKPKDSDSEYATVVVPCGKCPNCRLTRIQHWVFRLQQEDKIHMSAFFVTLTYSPENCPTTTNGFMTLDKRDCQLFFKRLRKATGCTTIKYYLAGEYGGKTYRPHYHAIIFDAPDTAIESSWTLGSVHFGQVSGDSIAYTAKYIDKPKRIPLHEMDDRLPEFSLMSKRMGANYLNPENVKWHAEKEASFVVVPGGYVQSLARYYRDKIFPTKEERFSIARLSARSHAEKFDQDVKEAGSLEEFYRQRFYSIRQAVKARLNNSNRDKI